MVTTVSEKFYPYLEHGEGRVLRAYKDSGGVWTIGIGFTMLSKVFAEYWMRTRGHALRAGDTITAEECRMLLKKLVESEYAPPVDRRFPDTLNQWPFDAAADTTFNCGAGTLKDKWAVALGDGEVRRAAELLKTTRVTARGKRLAGLVKRRASAARLMLTGDYGVAENASESTSKEEVAAYQRQLIALGYKPGEPDGVAGERTKAAVKAFQMDKGLTVDGKVGPATRATLNRAIDALTATKAVPASAAGGAVVGGGAEVVTQAPAPPTVPDVTPPAVPDVPVEALYSGLTVGLIFLAVAVVAWLLYRNRGVLMQRRTPA